jgi:hypothetical protein
LQSNQPLPPKPSTSLDGLARRISRWTTNSLLTVMLLVIALGFGRQVLRWWHHDTASRPPTPGELPSQSADAQVLAFGDQAWSIRRQEFAGPPADVPAALLALCRTAIAEARPRDGAADAAEQDVLKRLAAEKPAAEEPGRWRLYQWSEGFPLVSGILNVSGTLRVPIKSGIRSMPDTLGTSLAEPTYRVVIWGIGVPTSAAAWTLYVFQPGRDRSASGQGAAKVPLPPGSRRLASVGSAGSTITAFSADNDLGGSARQFYDRWFAEHGWIAAVPWQRSPVGWQARFELVGGSPAIAVDIRLGSDAQGRGTGLIMESPK